MRHGLPLLLPLLIATPAAATPGAGQACAGNLHGDALTIYRATALDIGKPDSIADLLRARVRPMVMAGQISQAAARPAAEAAGICLKALRD